MVESRLHILFLSALGVCALWVLGGLAGCNSAGCVDNHSAIPQAGFYAAGTGQAFTLDSVDIGGVGAPRDSLLVRAGQRVQTLNLPFRNRDTVTAYFFHYAYPAQGLDDPRLNDTITFRYTARPYFASEECGAMFVYQVHSVAYTRHLIDSVGVADTMITNIDRERLRVYFRVARQEGAGEQ